MSKKVGIVSCYFKHNYGSMLQAYATQKILDDMGIENETINIDKNVDFANGKKKYYMGQLLNFEFLKAKLGMVKLKIDKKINKQLGKNISIRDKKYEEFRKVFKLTEEYKTYAELNEKAKKDYSSVLVGSDQLWLPVNIVADYYTLNFVPDEVNKVSSENLEKIIKTLRIAVKGKKRITDTHKALFLFRARHLKEEIIRRK